MHLLDLSKERCPLAYVKCKQALINLAQGSSVRILLSDSATSDDIQQWAQQHALHYRKRTTSGGYSIEFSHQPWSAVD